MELNSVGVRDPFTEDNNVAQHRQCHQIGSTEPLQRRLIAFKVTNVLTGDRRKGRPTEVSVDMVRWAAMAGEHHSRNKVLN